MIFYFKLLNGKLTCCLVWFDKYYKQQYDVAIETPLEAALYRISEKLNNNIRFKREDLRPLFHLSCAVPITALADFLELNLNVV